MIFFDHGQPYNTQDMLSFRTGDLRVPFIFMTPDHAEVFLFRKDGDGAMRPAKATEEEIRTAERVFGIRALSDAHGTSKTGPGAH